MGLKCVTHGHDFRSVCKPGRVYAVCNECGLETPGWEIRNALSQSSEESAAGRGHETSPNDLESGQGCKRVRQAARRLGWFGVAAALVTGACAAIARRNGLQPRKDNR